LILDPARDRSGADVCPLRDVWLAPSRYTLEAVAYESPSGQAGVVTQEPEVKEGMRALDRLQLVIVRGALPAAEAPADFESDHPLRFGDVMQPYTGESLSRPSPASAGLRPGVRFLGRVGRARRHGRDLAGSAPPHEERREMGAFRRSGLLRHVAVVPVGALDTRSYELRVTLSEGVEEPVLHAPFVVTE
jgi:hypothetical protein